MPSASRKAYWRFDSDETSLVSTEHSAGRQPVADPSAPVHREREEGTSDWVSEKGVMAPRPKASHPRAAIGHGQARDKSSRPGPAAAPLGADDEAAGRDPSPERVDLAASREIQSPAQASQATSNMLRDRRLALALTLVGAAVLVLVVFEIIT